jgi:hypothetical protein
MLLLCDVENLGYFFPKFIKTPLVVFGKQLSLGARTFGRMTFGRETLIALNAVSVFVL